MGKTEWVQSLGRVPDDIACARAVALNAEYVELIRAIREERASEGRQASDAEQAAMQVLGLDNAAELDAVAAVAELFKEVVAGKSISGLAGKMARVKTVEAAASGKPAVSVTAPEKVSDVYDEDLRLFGAERRGEKAVQVAVDGFIKAVGDIRFASITHRHALQFKEHLIGNGNQAATVNRRFGPLKAMWNRWAKRSGAEGRNPFAGVTMKITSSRDAKLPFHTSHLSLIAAGAYSDQTSAQIALMRATGIGPGELAGLLPEDLIFDHEIPHIWVRSNKRRELKTGEVRDRRIPILDLPLDQVRAALITKYNDHTPLGLSAKLNKALRAAGLPETPRLTCYSFRHTIKAALRESNAPTFITDRIMGHAGEKGAGGLYGASKARLDAKRAALEAAHGVLGQVERAIFSKDELPS